VYRERGIKDAFFKYERIFSGPGRRVRILAPWLVPIEDHALHTLAES
jgi:hypothetical protein